MQLRLGSPALALFAAQLWTAANLRAQPAAEPSEAISEAEIEAALQADAEAQERAAAPTAKGPPPAAADPANLNLALIADFAAAWFSEDDHLQTGAHDPTRTGFNLQALELSFGAAVDPYLRLDGQLVFGEQGVEIEEAYATTLDLPIGLQARFGRFATRFGRINAKHLHAWHFADQPFYYGRVFGGEGNRGLGVELSLLTPLPWYVELAASVTQASGAESNRSFFGDEDLGVETPADLLYVTALEQFFPLTDDWSLAWGLSGAFGPNSTGRSNRTEVYGTDFYLKYRPISRQSSSELTLEMELLHRRRQVRDDVLADFGGYTQLGWRFDQRWGSAVRYEYGSPSFDSEGKTSSDPLDPEWLDSRHRMTAALTHWPTEFSRFRLQASRDMPGWRDAIWAAFLTAELVAGAHGAHTF